jgi:hypothetical protein
MSPPSSVSKLRPARNKNEAGSKTMMEKIRSLTAPFPSPFLTFFHFSDIPLSSFVERQEA